ncbi:MAG TPA: hypothetical protein VMX35_09045 [Acidobacteriota bacterium]|nr:hypothetical protein [Acidobacteriota bacterium]
MRSRLVRPALALSAGALTLALLLSLWPLGAVATAEDKEEAKLKITLHSPLRQGIAPLPVHFVATIVGPPELDEQIYSDSFEWRIMSRQVLTDRYTGGNITPTEMRNEPVSSYERMLRGSKHLESRTRIRSPRVPYSKDKEVKRIFEFDYDFKLGGEYFISFRMIKSKVHSNEIRIQVQGDTSYDPFRQR